jgi:hypothetical protein
MENLTAVRYEVNDKRILSNDSIDDLEEAGILTDSQAKQLKAIKWDSKGKTYKTAPKVKKPKKVSLKLQKLTLPKTNIRGKIKVKAPKINKQVKLKYTVKKIKI